MLGADFFDLGQQQFFLLVDYWSGFFEVQEVKVATSSSVIAVCKVQFARHGRPDVLITDSGTQFTSSAVSAFVKEWQFEHRTSSPRYPQPRRKYCEDLQVLDEESESGWARPSVSPT